MKIPQEITAGTTIIFTDYLADYPADTYILKYRLINSANSYDIISVADGESYKTTITKTTSLTYTAGTYKWLAYVDKIGDATVRYEIGDGTIIINPDIISAATFETRTDNKIILDSIIAVIKGRATQSQESVQIAGRAIKYFTPDQLEKLRGIYEQRVFDEQAEDRIDRGEAGRQRILTQFGIN